MDEVNGWSKSPIFFVEYLLGNSMVHKNQDLPFLRYYSTCMRCSVAPCVETLASCSAPSYAYPCPASSRTIVTRGIDGLTVSAFHDPSLFFFFALTMTHYLSCAQLSSVESCECLAVKILSVEYLSRMWGPQ